MTRSLILAAFLLVPASITSAQCPNCQPAPSSAQTLFPDASAAPSYVMVRQRRGLFGWRCRWVAVPVMVQPARTAPPVFIIR